MSDPLARVLELGGEPLRGRLERTETRLREIGTVSPFALGTIAAGGKRLRPLLVFVCGVGAADDERLVRAAVSIELIHSATLVHDDVLDRASLRRGRPTVYASGGRLTATATGDLLFARAFGELGAADDDEALRLLAGAAAALAEGELLQREDAWRTDIDEARYLRRCELKTARLFEAACALGGGPALGEYGRLVGLAFQLFDDVLDVSGDPDETGKRRGADLLDGTVTLPFLVARERDRQLAELDLRTLGEPGARAACERIEAAGGAAATRERALELIGDAKRALPAGASGGLREALELVADSVVDRYT